jgi:uncharacterized Zn finger protein
MAQNQNQMNCPSCDSQDLEIIERGPEAGDDDVKCRSCGHICPQWWAEKAAKR